MATGNREPSPGYVVGRNGLFGLPTLEPAFDGSSLDATADPQVAQVVRREVEA